MATEQQDLLFVEALGDPPELETFPAFRKYVNLACADQYQLLQGAECTYDPDPVVRVANEANKEKKQASSGAQSSRNCDTRAVPVVRY